MTSPRLTTLIPAFQRTHFDADDARSRQQMQLAQAWQAAEQGRRACSALLGEIGNDLRAPLLAIRAGMEPALVEDSIENALGLIDRMLDAARTEAGKLTVTPQEFDACELLAEVGDAAKPLADLHGNELHVVCQPMGPMRADSPKIRHVLFSLVKNACQSTQRGQITLRAWRDGASRVRFEVIDNGMGMNGAIEAFNGLAAASNPGGLSLAACRKLCQIMGGTISVRSATGSGSTFTVILPVT